MPVTFLANSLNKSLTLKPVFADVSKNIKFFDSAYSFPYRCVTYRCDSISALLPTKISSTSSSLIAFASSIHLSTDLKPSTFVISQQTIATVASLIYEGINDLKRSYPAVSHRFKMMILSSTYIFYDMKSIPIVAQQLSSKLSQINRWIIDVLPTFWSPRNTILYFNFPQAALVSVLVVAISNF